MSKSQPVARNGALPERSTASILYVADLPERLVNQNTDGGCDSGAARSSHHRNRQAARFMRAQQGRGQPGGFLAEKQPVPSADIADPNAGAGQKQR